MSTIQIDVTDETAAALVAHIRSAVNGIGKYAAYVERHGVTRETVKDHAAALAALAYPNEEPVQKKDGKRTKYGNAVQAAGNGLRSALPKSDEQAAADYLAKIIKAVDAGVEHEISAADILAAVTAHLKGENA